MFCHAVGETVDVGWIGELAVTPAVDGGDWRGIAASKALQRFENRKTINPKNMISAECLNKFFTYWSGT